MVGEGSSGVAEQTQRSALTAGGSLPTDEIAELTLAVARLGEHDRRGWWQSRAFGPAGRVVLKTRLPRTWRAAALEIDIEAARRRHEEVIERPNAVHLFSAVWPVGRWVRSWLAETKMSVDEPSLLLRLEEMSTDELLALVAERSEPIEQAQRNGRAIYIGTASQSDLLTPDSALPLVRKLAGVYATMDEFAVPYMDVVS